MMYRLAIFLFGSFLIIAAASVSSQVTTAPVKRGVSATLRVHDPGKWKVINKGIEFRKMSLERSEASYSLELKLVRFETRWVSPRVVRSGQYQLKGSDVKNLAALSGALAMINANYFDEKGRPLGFLKVGAQVINANISKSSLFTGIFGIGEKGPFIRDRDEFQPPDAEEAVQAGPLLLNHGAAVEITRGQGRQSRRALIGIDKNQRVIVGVTDAIFGGLAWAELQELFSNPKWQLETPDLLNLDGGGSAQLYVKTKGLEEFVAGTSEVPVALGFFDKKTQ
jgi:uncharacterized protein YigE (DUF2233 family)